MILSIAIPSYNRPRRLLKLLDSIDLNSPEIEVVICEDSSPKRNEIREIVEKFSKSSSLLINYMENKKNLGYDANIRNLIKNCEGDFIIFMGDDDFFIEGALKKYIEFIKNNQSVGYILRSYLSINPMGYVEEFRYLKNETIFPSGKKSVLWLFKRSVNLSGFTISRAKSLPFVDTNELDGTLLTQVYLMSEVCLRYPSVYCPILVSYAHQSYRDDAPNFGNSEKEKSRYVPGRITEDNSINFTKAYFEVCRFIEKKNSISIENELKNELSKYSYPFLSIQRKNGVRNFLTYAKRLERECGLNSTYHYYFYKYALLVFGEQICSFCIYQIKKILGYTPNF